MAARKLKVSTTGYKENSKDKNLDKLYVPSSNLTMTGVKKHVKATPVYPNDMYGNPITMIPGVPSYTFPGAVGVIEEKLPQAQQGLPNDYEAFLKYSETAPENRRPDAEWQYGNPRQYDHYGMWDALGKPKNFEEALANYPQWQPDPGDGYYHGFSTNPNTGVWLKSHIPGENKPGDTGWMEYKDFMLSNDRNWGGKNQNLIFDPEIQRMRYVERKKQGGPLHRMQIEGQFSNPNFKPSYDWRKSPKENAELNRRAEAAGHNSVGEYEASGWAWQPEKTHFTKGQGTGIGIIKAQPKQQTWDQQVMEGIPGYSTLPPKAKSKTTTSSSSLKADIKKMNQDLISGFAVAESTMPANTFKPPLEWEGKTGPQILAEVRAEEARIKAEKEREAYEKLNRHDTLTAKRTTPAQETVNQIYYALSNPIEAAGHAMKYGYIPQGNLGNYGYREDGDAFSDVTQYANPFFYANAAYRLSNAALQPESWTTKEGLINMASEALEAAPIVKPLGMAINSARMTAGPLVKSAGKVYNKVATGNSRLTDFGFPAWKVERPNFPIKSSGYIPKTYTDAQAGLLDKFGKGMKLTPEEWAQMEDFTRSGATDFSKADYPISRILGYYERGSAENKLLEGLKAGDVFNTPTEKTIRTWSVGTPGAGDLSAFGNTRLVVPSRYTKGLGSNFAGMPYSDKRIPFIWNPKTGLNSGAISEKEIMGNIPKGFKVIGSSKENGLNNLIIKPLKEGGELPKAEEGGDFDFSYDSSKSVAENMELNRRAQAMGWNSVKEYEASNWGRKGYARVPDVIRQQRIAKGIPADQIPEYEKIEEKKISPELASIIDLQEGRSRFDKEKVEEEQRKKDIKNFRRAPINDPAGLPSVPIFESLLMAPVALGEAGLAGLGELVYGAAASSPLVQATVAGGRQLLNAAPKAVPWLNAGNALTYGFGVHGLKTIQSGQALEPWRHANDTGNPLDYANAFAENLITALEIAPFAAPVLKAGYELAKPAMNATNNFVSNIYKYNPLAFDIANAESKIVGKGKEAFLADSERNYTAYKAKPNFLMGYREIKDASKLNWDPLIGKVKADAEAKMLENFVTLTGGKADDIDLAQFADYWKAYNNRWSAQYKLAEDLTDIGRAKIKGSPFDTRSNFSDAWGIGRDQAKEFRTLLEEQNIQPNSPLGRSLGNGAEGMVFELADDPGHVIKVGQTFKTDNVDDLLKSFEGVIGDNIAVVKRAHKDGSGLIEIMPNLNRTGKFQNLTKEEVLNKLEADARDLMSRGFFLDVDNLRGNFRYNDTKNVVDIYDVSKPAQGISYQNPDLVIEKLREHFNAFDRIPEKHPLYRSNSAVSKPAVQLTGAEATKRLDAARKEFASLVGRGFENLTPDELLNLYNLEGEISTLTNSVKKLGGTAKPRDHKSLDNYFEAAWTNSRKTN